MLHLNMCGLETSFELNVNVPGLKERIKNNIPAQLAYACTYWAGHLKSIPFAPDSQVSRDLIDELNSFVYNYLLHWLEVLSLLKALDRGIPILIECSQCFTSPVRI